MTTQLPFGQYSNVQSGTRSLINITESEWRTRKINLISLLKGFVGQLKPGEDLTKVSLPSVLCHPFSMLELLSQRILLTYHILFDLNTIEDPLERFMVVVKFVVSIVRQETMEKKPFNPVVGETHLCWTENGPGDFTEYVSEQVSHHPPISALYVNNPLRNITLDCNPTFGVRFGSNHAAITTFGTVTIKTKNGTYEISKLVPDGVMHNVIRGKRYMTWEGDILVSCAEQGFNAVVTFKEDKASKEKCKPTIFTGQVFRNADELVYNLEGACSKQGFFWENSAESQKKILLDFDKLQESFIMYLPDEFRNDLSSEVVWAKVCKAIIVDDMYTADAEKKLVEADQRKREAKKKQDGLSDEGTFFSKDSNSLDGNWSFRGNLDLIHWLKLISVRLDATPKKLEKEKEKEKTIEKAGEKAESHVDKSNEITQTTPLNPSSSSTSSTPVSSSLPSFPASSTSATPNVTISTVQPIPIAASAVVLTGVATQAAGSPPEETAAAPVGGYSDDEWPEDSSDESEEEIGGLAGAQTQQGTGNSVSTSAGNSAGHPHPTRKSSSFTASTGTSISASMNSNKKDREAEKLRREKKKLLRKEKKEIVAKGKEQKKASGLIPEKDIIKSGFIKIRNAFKKWNVRYAILIEGKLVYFKTMKDVSADMCAGIVLLQSCLVNQRPSKKAGFCIKIFSVYQHTIFSRQDLRGKPLRKVIPASLDYCLLRVKDDETGKDWISALRSAIPNYDDCKKFAPSDHADSVSSSADDEEGDSSGDEGEGGFENGGISPPIEEVVPTADKLEKPLPTVAPAPKEQAQPEAHAEAKTSRGPAPSVTTNLMSPATTAAPTQDKAANRENRLSRNVPIPTSQSTTTAPSVGNSTPSAPTVGLSSQQQQQLQHQLQQLQLQQQQHQQHVHTQQLQMHTDSLREIREELKGVHEQLNTIQLAIGRGGGELDSKKLTEEFTKIEKRVAEHIAKTEARLAFTVRTAASSAIRSDESVAAEGTASRASPFAKIASQLGISAVSVEVFVVIIVAFIISGIFKRIF